jgi:GNAT superfamily N-acetyltransferase
MHPTKNFAIAEAVESDVQDLLAMIRELAEFENLQKELEVTHASLRDALFGERPAANAFLLRAENESAGYAVYYRTFSTFTGRPGIFLDDVYVRPAYRNRGLGRALIERVARSGMGERPGRYEWIAFRWNGNALQFYQNLGAQLLTEWVLVRMNGEPLRRLIGGAS